MLILAPLSLWEYSQFTMGAEDQTAEVIGKGPFICRPEDVDQVAKLGRKLEEYRNRVTLDGQDAYAHPGKIVWQEAATRDFRRTDALIKSRLLEAVLEHGEVDTWEFSKELTEESIFEPFRESDPAGFVRAIDRACGVIDAYCRDDLKGIVGGTGLR